MKQQTEYTTTSTNNQNTVTLSFEPINTKDLTKKQLYDYIQDNYRHIHENTYRLKNNDTVFSVLLAWNLILTLLIVILGFVG